MGVDGLDDGTDAEDGRRQHQRLLPAQAVGDGPDDEACCEGASLLQSDAERVDAGLVGGGVVEVVDVGGEGQHAAYKSRSARGQARGRSCTIPTLAGHVSSSYCEEDKGEDVGLVMEMVEE